MARLSSQQRALRVVADLTTGGDEIDLVTRPVDLLSYYLSHGRLCATCVTCSRRLDQSSAVPGQDNLLYCQVNVFATGENSLCLEHCLLCVCMIETEFSGLLWSEIRDGGIPRDQLFYVDR